MIAYPPLLTHGSGVTMTHDPSRLLLGLKAVRRARNLEATLAAIGLLPEGTGATRQARPAQGAERINQGPDRVWVQAAEGGAIADAMRASVDEQAESLALDWVGPVYRMPNVEGRAGLLCPLPHVLVLKPAAGVRPTSRAFTSALARFGLTLDAERSKYLGDFVYCRIDDPRTVSAYELRAQLIEAREWVAEARFENLPLLAPHAIVPNDPLWPQQWNMARISAPAAWDITPGSPPVVVCVLDEGCDLTHPDLVPFASPGIRLDTMGPDGSPTGNHGTACAGILAARFNNAVGVAGLAARCSLLPVAFVSWTDVEVAAGINYAAGPGGAKVISMSFGWNAWDHAIIDPAIEDAHAAGVVMCAATHNHNGPITYPASHPLVMACGASDQSDNRKSPTSPDGETWWGSDFGPELSVVAPGVLIPTTDRQGNLGYNTAAGVAGDYYLKFNGTSAATPHVAALAALLRSQYPSLTNAQVRSIIESTADKVGQLPYAETPGHPHGTWNQEMGYGRINAFRALDAADVLIRDYAADSGLEPSAPPGGDFWDCSDIVVRGTDDDVVAPEFPKAANQVVRGQTNYLYVRVLNSGPREARNVVVDARVVPYVGLEFVYPADWSALDPTHVAPTPVVALFASIPAGATALAKFTLSAAQVETLWGWDPRSPWNPSILVMVTAENDYRFSNLERSGGSLVGRRNNLAERNQSLVWADPLVPLVSPFVAGHRLDLEDEMKLAVDRSRLPSNMSLLLALDGDGSAFPLLDLSAEPGQVQSSSAGHIVFLERTRLALDGCCGHGVLTLEAGSRYDCLAESGLVVLKVEGGEVLLRGDRRFVEVRAPQAIVTLQKQPGRRYPMALHTALPGDAGLGQSFSVTVAQRGPDGSNVGGAGMVYIVNPTPAS